MISIVGFFLLNNILVGDKTPTPAEVLNNLDLLVTETFKQNEDNSKLKDGMDLVICRIDHEKNIFESAGANRPVYVINKEGNLEEIKGDKFPIGGGSSYTNKTSFSNFKKNIIQGDGFYFFSDGLPDQFNEESTQKLGTRIIKDILKSNHGKDIKLVEKRLDEKFLEWKGSNNQTDDILFIGMVF